MSVDRYQRARRNDPSLTPSLERKPVEPHISSALRAILVRSTHSTCQAPYSPHLCFALDVPSPFPSTSRILNCRIEIRASRYSEHAERRRAQSSPSSRYRGRTRSRKLFVSGCASYTIDTERARDVPKTERAPRTI